MLLLLSHLLADAMMPSLNLLQLAGILHCNCLSYLTDNDSNLDAAVLSSSEALLLQQLPLGLACRLEC